MSHLKGLERNLKVNPQPEEESGRMVPATGNDLGIFNLSPKRLPAVERVRGGQRWRGARSRSNI